MIFCSRGLVQFVIANFIQEAISIDACPQYHVVQMFGT